MLSHLKKITGLLGNFSQNYFCPKHSLKNPLESLWNHSTIDKKVKISRGVCVCVCVCVCEGVKCVRGWWVQRPRWFQYNKLKKKFLQAFLIPTEGSDSSQRSLANEKLQFHCLDQSSVQGKVAETNRRLKPTHFLLSELHWWVHCSMQGKDPLQWLLPPAGVRCHSTTVSCPTLYSLPSPQLVMPLLIFLLWCVSLVFRWKLLKI